MVTPPSFRWLSDSLSGLAHACQEFSSGYTANKGLCMVLLGGSLEKGGYDLPREMPGKPKCGLCVEQKERILARYRS
jgi:hypothetical protein